ncbi:Fanconi anemia group J protein homolog isoform X2 [Leptidea sinapis]|uniref:Fanconi anemia group J protein homolog isoform X2 n=1 Tax=Leptidea sinapis TaxID=189913 RepID=UPI0021C41283|nr:Fanconi anemia group J protein homolog isoform X2 [Leptidea sinapis]
MESIEISDDDESFEEPVNSKQKAVAYEISSDEELPNVEIRSKRQTYIHNLFPKTATISSRTNETSRKPGQTPNVNPIPDKCGSGIEKMIGGVKVILPVNPYGSQLALMSIVIKAIKNNQNCLLESPTGSGKTLALLCATLAWQMQERKRLNEKLTQSYFNDHPELNNLLEGHDSYKTMTADERGDFFNKFAYSKKTIYSDPDEGGDTTAVCGSSKRQEPLNDSGEGSPTKGLVTIHKRRRLYSSEVEDSKAKSGEPPSTPDKKIQVSEPTTPEEVSLPIIYYGARTHKQIQQVVREFSRTEYCGKALMTVLSSREYSCIREFDRKQWATKNDMCRGCVQGTDRERNRESTNCAYYNNRKALNHKALPHAFDLEELVRVGEEIRACPYYAAREMANAAHIVFCPYNYLIEPGIRSSMQIDVSGNIVIIDEGHNIEDVCRDAATFTVTKAQLDAAILELQKVAQFTYANQDSMGYIEHLLKVLNSWEQWFVNQKPLLSKAAVNNGEAVYTWAVEHFTTTLHNHNIGQKQYAEFRHHAELFCRRLREDPRTLFGVTQATGSLVETIDTVLGYLFRHDGKYMDDFVPVLVRHVVADEVSENFNWRNSQFDRSVEKESLSLRLLCMNPALVFEALSPARSILLASGTLTPLVSLHSELASSFPLQISPNHIIPKDRVWIGTLGSQPDRSRLECTSRACQEPATQDALGAAVLHVCRVTPSGVLCFLPSYGLMNTLVRRWRETNVWSKLEQLKHVFMESRNVRDHSDIMEDYYKYSASEKGALLFAVYRGKVSEGMDFKDHQARAVIAIGVPYPNTYDMAVKEKMKYNNRYTENRKLLPGNEWLRVQAYRALNQAVGRCVRHVRDWGGVLLVDARFQNPHYTEHLSKWLANYLGNNHHTFDSLVNGPNNLETFMQNMKIRDEEEVM